MPKTDLPPAGCAEVLEREDIGYLAMCSEERPYCIPVSFLFDSIQHKIYIHTGITGAKWDILAENPRVCLTVTAPGRKVTGEDPCRYTYEFKSVIVYGYAMKVSCPDELQDSLQKLVGKYSEGPVSPVPEDKLAKLRMIRIDIEKITGRQNF